MPVLRMAMVTSPGFKSDPAATLSAVGSAALIHKSWLGLVYTPMLGLRDDLADETGVSACVAAGAMSPARDGERYKRTLRRVLCRLENTEEQPSSEAYVSR